MSKKICTINSQSISIREATLTKIPGDKSISHRAVILAALSSQSVEITNFLASDDCLNTAAIFKKLGVQITHKNETTLVIKGNGKQGLVPTPDTLDVGNSGTSIRLLTGLLSAQSFNSTIAGDASIAKRPMKRVIDPVSQMGAKITGQSLAGKTDIYPPLTIDGTPQLNGINYDMPVASAQVKSAILLAGLFAQSPTTIIEKKPSRDHTERMLQTFGVDITRNRNTITLVPPTALTLPEPAHIQVPSDFSSAAFFIVLGAIIPGLTLTLTGIGINPTRSALIDVLKKMNANITVTPTPSGGAEPIATITVTGGQLTNIDVPSEVIPIIIDEIPILSVAALLAKGTMRITNAEELRVKESDRIAATVALITAIGGQVEETPDGFITHQLTQAKSFSYDAGHDHRMAMSAIILALATQVDAVVKGCDYIQTSFPNFFELLQELKIQFSLE
jgi:3-phosphoshikimate 1-carboxyvinyltransferase